MEANLNTLQERGSYGPLCAVTVETILYNWNVMEPLWPMPKDDDDLLHKSVRFETSRAKLEEYSSLSCSLCNLLLSKSNDFLCEFVTVNVSLSLRRPRGQQF